MVDDVSPIAGGGTDVNERLLFGLGLNRSRGRVAARERLLLAIAIRICDFKVIPAKAGIQ